METSDGGANSVFIFTNRKTKPQYSKSHTHEESHADPSPLSFTHHHVLPLCEFSVPSAITSTSFSYLLSSILGFPLSSFYLHVSFSKSMPASLSWHGEASVYTRQRGCFYLDCDVGSHNPQGSTGPVQNILQATAHSQAGTDSGMLNQAILGLWSRRQLGIIIVCELQGQKLSISEYHWLQASGTLQEKNTHCAMWKAQWRRHVLHWLFLEIRSSYRTLSTGGNDLEIDLLLVLTIVTTLSLSVLQSENLRSGTPGV